MALAGHPVLVYAKATNAAAVGGDEVAGVNDVKYSPSLNLLDVTSFKDTTGMKIKIGGLRDGSVSVAGDLEMTDAPQTLFRTAAGDGSSVWMTLHFNPSGSASQKGFQVECKVASFEISAAVDGKVTFSASLEFTGAPVLV